MRINSGAENVNFARGGFTFSCPSIAQVSGINVHQNSIGSSIYTRINSQFINGDWTTSGTEFSVSSTTGNYEQVLPVNAVNMNGAFLEYNALRQNNNDRWIFFCRLFIDGSLTGASFDTAFTAESLGMIPSLYFDINNSAQLMSSRIEWYEESNS